MKKIYIPIIIIIFTIVFLASCETSAPPPIDDTHPADNININDNPAENEPTNIELAVNTRAVELLATCNTKYKCESIPTNNRYTAFNIGEIFYVVSNITGEGLYELSLDTGNLELICKDPLCSHKKAPCVEAAYLLSYVIDNNDVYVLGECEKNEDEGMRFIGKVNAQFGTFEILKEIAINGSSDSLSFEYQDGYLYYTQPTSEKTSELYRYNITTGKEEQLSSLDEYIVVFTVDENNIYFRNNYYILKKASHDFSKIEELDTGVSIMFPAGDKLYYFINEYDNSGNRCGYALICMDINKNKKETLLTNVYTPSGTLYDKGLFYYTHYNFLDDKNIYVYDSETRTTTQYPVGKGSRCYVTAIYDHLLILSSYTEIDPVTGLSDLEYYLYDTTTNEMVQIFYEQK